MKANALLVPLALLALSACEQATAPAVPATPSNVLIPLAKPQGAPRVAELTPAQKEAYWDAFRAVNKAVDTEGQSWKRRHADVQRALDAYDGQPLDFQIEQMAASKMLSRHLLPAAASADRDEAVALYTRSLLNNQHEDAGLLADALGELEGTWAPAELRASAAQAVTFGERYLIRESRCRGKACGTVLQDLRSRGLGLGATEQRVSVGLDRLEALN